MGWKKKEELEGEYQKTLEEKQQAETPALRRPSMEDIINKLYNGEYYG
jgi:hypothetical protein